MTIVDTGLPPAGFQEYDEALRDFFTMRVYPDQIDPNVYETLVPVTGPPVLNLGTQEGLDPLVGPLNTRQNQIVKLPATAITQLGWTFDLKRWTRAHYRRLGWTEDGTKVIQSPQIIPVDIMYQLDLWSKYRTTMNQMLRNVQLLFVNREPWLDVDLKGIWGVRRIPLTLMYKGPDNLTDLEPDNKDRTVRMVYSFIFHAWAIPDATMLPVVSKIIKEFYYPTNLAANYPILRDIPPYPEWVNTGIKSVEENIPLPNQNP
jgi:hypothetical protein